MACLEMYNNNSAAADTNSTSTSTSAANFFSTAPPRISFSTDFADSSHPTIPKSPLGTSSSSAAAASSLDFEFSVGNHSMMAADELFFQGQMLPFKDSGGVRKPTTLREELLAGDEEEDGGVALCRPPKGPTRWKGFLGLRKTHIGSSKKPDHPKLPPSVAAADQDAAMHND